MSKSSWFVSLEFVNNFKDIITELRKDDGVGTARRGSDAADEVSLLKMK